jgi:aminopeptidase N
MSNKKTNYLKDYKAPSFNVESIDLELDLRDDVTKVKSTMKFISNPENPSESLLLSGRHQVLEHVILDGCELSTDEYDLTEEALTIHKVPEQFELVIKTAIDPANNTSLMGLYKSAGNYCTQCESDGFRKITYYLDRPDVLSIFTTTIIANKEMHPQLLANGNLIDHGDLEEGRHFAKWYDPFKKPCYLFAMVAGDFESITDKFKTCSGREVTLKIFASKQAIGKCAYAMEALKKSMKWDEEAYGREYDLDIFMIVAVNDFNFGAMENKGLNVFNDKYILVDPKMATDQDYALIDAVVGHEYFHNWSGNRVTLRDWFQLSLKEGFTVFREQSFSEFVGSDALERIIQIRRLRAAQFPEDAGPLSHPVRPESYIEMNNFYTMTVYEKGAEVIRMLSCLLGAETFRKATDRYFEKFDGQAVTCDDFVVTMEEVSGKDLTQFKRWYHQSGTPELKVETDYSKDKKEYTVKISQETLPTADQKTKEALHIPFAMGLLDEKGDEIPLILKGETTGESTKVLDVTHDNELFTFINVDSKPTPSFLRGFSAPVKLQYAYSEEELAFLMVHDQDPVARWEASQQFAINQCLKLVMSVQSKETLKVSLVYEQAFANLLEDKNTDKALIAEMLMLPSENTLADHMKTVDVDAIFEARKYLREVLYEAMSNKWVDCYKANVSTKAYEYNNEDAAVRRLKNTCLDYLICSKDSQVQSMIFDQFKSANNMTDQIAAFSSMTLNDHSDSEEAIKLFYEQWKHEALVVDKWFIVQAQSPYAGSLDKIQLLCEHPAFSMKNPNKVRSLLGVFIKNNLSQFHLASGEAYEFIADKVLETDAINPMVAARLVEPLTQWRRFDENRQVHMKAQLNRIIKHPALSGDTYEIVSKSLA